MPSRTESAARVIGGIGLRPRSARAEGRFAKHFDKDGNPSETLIKAKQERLDNWHALQELDGFI